MNSSQIVQLTGWGGTYDQCRKKTLASFRMKTKSVDLFPCLTQGKHFHFLSSAGNLVQRKGCLVKFMQELTVIPQVL